MAAILPRSAKFEAIPALGLDRTAPSLDHGEITDKGSVNQRAVLRHRSDLIAELYQLDGGRGVIQVD